MIKHLLAGMALTLVLVACDKDKDDDSQGSANNRRLTSSSWVYKSAGLDLTNDGTIDSDLPAGAATPCRLDNKYTFGSGGTGTIDEGASKCDPADPQTVAFNWAFADNETSIDLGGAALFGLGGRFRIQALNDTLFSMRRDTLISMPPFPPTTVGILINLKH